MVLEVKEVENSGVSKKYNPFCIFVCLIILSPSLEGHKLCNSRSLDNLVTDTRLVQNFGI